ncbi:MAG: hypothetical protein IPJ20_02820 [Flammeovirgaceae bacterium]|nr:hypothetical protein [Flammeovirgaceae bacterium]
MFYKRDYFSLAWHRSEFVGSLFDKHGSPGYFDGKKGFIAGGVSPGADWDVFAGRLNGLTPFNPKDISELVVAFK